jgi:hypothetical protein
MEVPQSVKKFRVKWQSITFVFNDGKVTFKHARKRMKNTPAILILTILTSISLKNKWAILCHMKIKFSYIKGLEEWSKISRLIVLLL